MYFHLLVVIISVLGYILFDLPFQYEMGFLVVSLFATFNFTRSIGQNGATRILAEEQKAIKLEENYHSLPSKTGSFIARNDISSPLLPNYEEMYIELENGGKFHGLSKKGKVNSLETGVEVRFYFYKVFIVHMEIVKEDTKNDL